MKPLSFGTRPRRALDKSRRFRPTLAPSNRGKLQVVQHIPVLLHQTLEGLAIKPDGRYWDGTFGGGGHSGEILARLEGDGRLTATDRDAVAEERAKQFATDARFTFQRGTILEMTEQLEGPWDGFLWDLGTSMMQLKDPERGFSFKDDGPLDMRMDRRHGTTAADLVNEMREEDLADLIYKYGEDRLSRRIAWQIVQARRHERIETTLALAECCRRAYPKKHHRIDPATRTFQALRIAVNEELDQVSEPLPKAVAKLAVGGRAAIISFHSLEDRIVKHCFRELAANGPYRIHTKKPLVADEQEARENPASRSAKLRVLERMPDGWSAKKGGRK